MKPTTRHAPLLVAIALATFTIGAAAMTCWTAAALIWLDAFGATAPAASADDDAAPASAPANDRALALPRLERLSQPAC